MNTLKVYSSNRSLMQHLDEGVLLSPHMMMNDFFTQILIIKGYRALPKQMRLPLAMEILKSCASELKRVNFIFEESFLAFLESSQFLFGFFDEISQAQVQMSEIPLLDTYGDYEDHLYVLEWVKKRYVERLEELKYYDGLILAPNAQISINEAFVRSFESIDIYIEGTMTKAHLHLLAQISHLSSIRVHFSLDEYNVNLPFLPKHILEQCEPFYRYSFDFHTGNLLDSKPQAINARVSAYSFNLRISQVALVFYMIEQWLKEGVKEEDIAVIVPNEDFTRYLALFDKAHNLNFAMGKDIGSAEAYKKLESMREAYKDDRVDVSYNRVSEEIQATLSVYDDRASQRVREYVGELLFMWEHIGINKCNFVEIIELLLKELEGCSIDDISGGKIRVMGVLESRGFACERAIIVDFNDDVIPSISQNDLFLNSALRKKLDMPTIKDKEQLQKHYYCAIFSAASEVVVSYVENDDKHKSLLLDELGAYLKSPIQSYNGDMYFALLEQGRKLEYVEDKLSGVLPRELSPSKLKILLECPRRYFYQYKEYLSDVGQDSAIFGNILHQCLESVYSPYVGKRQILDVQKLSQSAMSQLQNCMDFNDIGAVDRANIGLLMLELDEFLHTYEGGGEVEILCLEKSMLAQYGDFVFSVRPDRIQKNDECIEIIDYKYRSHFKVEKSAEKTSDFALLLYKQAFLQNYPQYASLPIKLLYWDIKECKKIEEESIAEKESVLLERLHSFKGEIMFDKAVKHSTCNYCPFTQLCDR
ncbi:PD-(D/E)XK nuclease family protein [Helicobacter typhlonius]|uniref:PD-(D/E)XK nuclease family protein n=1 Tax=Helicobacter typhlonius TaxID=76936 RepID=UPI002FE398EB